MKKIKRFLDQNYNKLSKSFYDNQWEGLRRKYVGSRGFVIGNGPSLSISDLDRLGDEITIASNKIYLSFEDTEWRPDFYTVVDEELWPKIKDDCFKNFKKIYLPERLKCSVGTFKRGVLFWDELPPSLSDPGIKCMFSDDAIKGFYGGYSVTYANLQLAVHLGLSPIYIIGCDHNYKTKTGANGECFVDTKFTNHFHGDYLSLGEKIKRAPVEKMNNAFLHARSYADRKNIKIYNATRGGCLDVFDRVDLDDLLL